MALIGHKSQQPNSTFSINILNPLIITIIKWDLSMSLTAIYSSSLSTRSASFDRRRPRFDASIRLHGDPNWTAARAALTARSTSSCRIYNTINSTFKWFSIDSIIGMVTMTVWFGLKWHWYFHKDQANTTEHSWNMF